MGAFSLLFPSPFEQSGVALNPTPTIYIGGEGSGEQDGIVVACLSKDMCFFPASTTAPQSEVGVRPVFACDTPVNNANSFACQGGNLLLSASIHVLF